MWPPRHLSSEFSTLLESNPIPSPKQLQDLLDETIDEVFDDKEEEDIISEMAPKAAPTPDSVSERFENQYRIWQRDVKLIEEARECHELDYDELVELYGKLKDTLNQLSDFTGADFDTLYPEYNGKLKMNDRFMQWCSTKPIRKINLCT